MEIDDALNLFLWRRAILWSSFLTVGGENLETAEAMFCHTDLAELITEISKYKQLWNDSGPSNVWMIATINQMNTLLMMVDESQVKEFDRSCLEESKYPLLT